jgi:ribonuclease J
MTKKKQKDNTGSVKIIPLGGLGEVGKNSWIFVSEDSWVIIDAGIGFPFNEYPGVELIYPSIDYIIENKDKIKALIISHAHEDHIGGALRILSHISVPLVYGSKLTVALLERKLEEASISVSTSFNKVLPREEITINPFKFKFLRTTHSVPDCFALLITSPAGKIMFTGDFKFDFTPIDGEQFDIPAIVEAGNEGIKLLISDSTNVEREGFSLSEKTVGPNILKIFEKTPKRIFITTFSSHIHRIQQIIDAAAKVKRKVAVAGYSMEAFFKIAKDTGYLKHPDGLVIPLEEILKLPENEIVIVTSGSQGEPSSILARMARKEHKHLQVIPGDTIVFSANPIPGNERAVSKLQDDLCALGADLVYGRSCNIHVSGHAAKEEQKLMIALTRPEHFLPAHGDYRMQVQHAELSANMGVDPQNIYILRNGDVLESCDDGFKVINSQIDAAPVYYDSMYGGIVNEAILKDRNKLGQEGLILVYALIDKDSDLKTVDIICRGVTFLESFDETQLAKSVSNAIFKSYERMKKFGTSDENSLKIICRDLINKHTEKKLYCKPAILVYTKFETQQGGLK